MKGFLLALCCGFALSCAYGGVVLYLEAQQADSIPLACVKLTLTAPGHMTTIAFPSVESDGSASIEECLRQEGKWRNAALTFNACLVIPLLVVGCCMVLRRRKKEAVFS